MEASMISSGMLAPAPPINPKARTFPTHTLSVEAALMGMMVSTRIYMGRNGCRDG